MALQAQLRLGANTPPLIWKIGSLHLLPLLCCLRRLLSLLCECVKVIKTILLKDIQSENLILVW